MSIEQKMDLHLLASGVDRRFGTPAYPQISNLLHRPLKFYDCNVPETENYKNGQKSHSGFGASLHLEKAVRSALGEAYERISLSHPFSEQKVKIFSQNSQPPSLRCLSLSELRDFQGFHPFQFNLNENRFNRLNETQTRRWIAAKKLIDNTEIWIPENLVCLSNQFDVEFDVTSNGCALAQSKQLATISAIFELIERDSFLYFWWRREFAQRVDYRSDLEKLDPKVVRAYGPWMDKVHVIYSPGAIGVTTLFTVFRSENALKHPAITVASACHLNPVKALQKSLAELAMMLNFNISLFWKTEKAKAQPISNFDKSFLSFEDHPVPYLYDEFAQNIFFDDTLKSQKYACRLSDLPNMEQNSTVENLEKLKNLLQKNHYDPIVVDQTSTDIASLGYSVVRVIDAKLIDLNPSHATRRWGKKRLFGGPVKSVLDLNHYPHPFP